MNPVFIKAMLIVIACGWLCRIAGCVICAYAQPLLPGGLTNPPSTITYQPSVTYPEMNARIDLWTVNGRLHAAKVTTNYLTNIIAVAATPRSGASTLSSVTTTYTTNAQKVLFDATGHAYAFTDAPQPVTVWYAYEITGLETTTNLADPHSWQRVGWDTRQGAQRFFRVAGTNYVEAAPLYLEKVSFTN